MDTITHFTTVVIHSRTRSNAVDMSFHPFLGS